MVHQGFTNKISSACATEDWRNDAENSALHHKNKLHFKLKYILKKYLSYFKLKFLLF